MNIDDFVLSLPNILKRIDEYGLYCYYLGFDPDIRETYISPIREDDNIPSFSFYQAPEGYEVEYLWKDGALDKSGTIAQLVMYMYGLKNIQDALRKIDTDFKLGFTDGTFRAEKIHTIAKPKEKAPAVIKVNSKSAFSPAGLKYWEEYGISQKTLLKYNVTELAHADINGKLIFYNNTLAFAYRIGDRYKIYTPTNKTFKFLNNYDVKFAEGFNQLPVNQSTLIITKSLKDVMVLHELGYEAISPRSETTVLPQEYFKWIKVKYKRCVVLFDNDLKHNGSKYPFPLIYVPLESGCKDISDYVKVHGKEQGKWLIEELLK